MSKKVGVPKTPKAKVGVPRPKVTLTGKSGKKYVYSLFLLPANFADKDGNYIYTKQGVQKGKWRPLYIGQGNLSERSDINNHHRSACLKRKGATHICARLNAHEEDRLAEEKDLLANYSQAYEPTGCNQKKGG